MSLLYLLFRACASGGGAAAPERLEPATCGVRGCADGSTPMRSEGVLAAETPKPSTMSAWHI
jgi:hypothetical protein